MSSVLRRACPLRGQILGCIRKEDDIRVGVVAAFEDADPDVPLTHMSFAEIDRRVDSRRGNLRGTPAAKRRADPQKRSRSWVEQSLVTVRPADQVRRAAIGTARLEHLTVPE